MSKYTEEQLVKACRKLAVQYKLVHTPHFQLRQPRKYEAADELAGVYGWQSYASGANVDADIALYLEFELDFAERSRLFRKALEEI